MPFLIFEMETRRITGAARSLQAAWERARKEAEKCGLDPEDLSCEECTDRLFQAVVEEGNARCLRMLDGRLGTWEEGAIARQLDTIFPPMEGGDPRCEYYTAARRLIHRTFFAYPESRENVSILLDRLIECEGSARTARHRRTATLAIYSVTRWLHERIFEGMGREGPN